MAKFKVIEYRNSLGNRRGWTVVTLPSDYREGDVLPASHVSDRYFETEAEAAANPVSKSAGFPDDALARRAPRCIEHGSASWRLLPWVLLGTHVRAVCGRRDEPSLGCGAWRIYSVEKVGPAAAIFSRVAGVIMMVVGIFLIARLA